jgi:predicted nucleic acid-binding protein
MPQKPSEIKVRDEDDQWVLESALQAKADILVTGDKDLIIISKNVPGLRITTPREFWELLKK